MKTSTTEWKVLTLLLSEEVYLVVAINNNSINSVSVVQRNEEFNEENGMDLGEATDMDHNHLVCKDLCQWGDYQEDLDQC
jgi:hypothetical protein